MGWLVTQALSLWAWLVAVQRDISTEMAAMLRSYETTGDVTVLLAFLPWAVIFGAAHALTPGHSKTVLGAYVIGSGVGPGRAVGIAMSLAATHIAMSVVIVLLALPVIEVTVGRAGTAPVLEDLSRGLIGVIGVWLLALALMHREPPREGEGYAFGIAAGLIPCPLTLFVMTLAAARGVTEAGAIFALMMLIGVGIVLSAVAGVATLTRRSATVLRQERFDGLARVLLGASGLFLLMVGLVQLVSFR